MGWVREGLLVGGWDCGGLAGFGLLVGGWVYLWKLGATVEVGGYLWRLGICSGFRALRKVEGQRSGLGVRASYG